MELDVKVFKALGSETRLAIIKNLKQQRMTLTELSAKLGMHASTVKEHLDLMARTGLVEQQNEGRKWKYYSLTLDCKRLLSPFPSEIRILIPLSLVLFAIGLNFTGYSYMGNESASSVFDKASQPGDITNDQIFQVPQISSVFVLLGCVLVIISAYLVARKIVFLERLGKNPRI